MFSYVCRSTNTPRAAARKSAAFGFSFRLEQRAEKRKEVHTNFLSGIVQWYVFLPAFPFPIPKNVFVPYFQFFQKLEEKIQAKELEQTNLQEKSKVRVASLFISYFWNICMIYSWNSISTLRRAKRLRSNCLGRAWHLKRHPCQVFTRSSLLKLSWKR